MEFWAGDFARGAGCLGSLMELDLSVHFMKTCSAELISSIITPIPRDSPSASSFRSLILDVHTSRDTPQM